jgi:hypothetical protein
MSGTKRTYNLSEKNYFKFFGIEEKHSISVRSLTTHYKKILFILKDDPTFLGNATKLFAERAFNTLVDPILRAKYIVELAGYDTDISDNVDPSDIALTNHYQQILDYTTDAESLSDFIDELKEQTSFIIDQIETSIDTYKNYKMAMGLISKFYEISNIHKNAKEKQEKIADGITYVVFD